MHNDGKKNYDSGSKRFTKDHFNFSSYGVVEIYYNGLKGEQIIIKYSRWQLGMERLGADR